MIIFAQLCATNMIRHSRSSSILSCFSVLYWPSKLNSSRRGGRCRCWPNCWLSVFAPLVCQGRLHVVMSQGNVQAGTPLHFYHRRGYSNSRLDEAVDLQASGTKFGKTGLELLQALCQGPSPEGQPEEHQHRGMPSTRQRYPARRYCDGSCS